jgi:hypothetical protein
MIVEFFLGERFQNSKEDNIELEKKTIDTLKN